MIIVVTGPSGCGKSTIIGRALSDLDGVRFSVSHTTRPPRGNEAQGREYFFVSEPEFRRMIGAGRFVEWAVVHGHYYGTSVKELESRGRKGDVILDIDVQGARQMRKKRGKEAVFVFILPPLYAELKKRLEGRGEDGPEVIRRRLERARAEIKDFRRFDYLIVNQELETAAAELKAVILGERCRRVRREKTAAPILRSFEQGGRVPKRKG